MIFPKKMRISRSSDSNTITLHFRLCNVNIFSLVYEVKHRLQIRFCDDHLKTHLMFYSEHNDFCILISQQLYLNHF